MDKDRQIDDNNQVSWKIKATKVGLAVTAGLGFAACSRDTQPTIDPAEVLATTQTSEELVLTETPEALKTLSPTPVSLEGRATQIADEQMRIEAQMTQTASVEGAGEATVATPDLVDRTPTSADLTSMPDTPQERELFMSPVQAERVINEESSWLIAEPGVLLDNTATFVIPSVDLEHFANVPEGGFTYFSMGAGTIRVGEVELSLQPAEGRNHLVLIRGRIDDGIVDSDLNETAKVTDFVPGHGIWGIMPPGAYVSADWFMQNLEVSTTTGGTNCGATGCSETIITLHDVDSGFTQIYRVDADDLENWELLHEGVVQRDM